MGWLDGLLGGDDSEEQKVTSEPWKPSQKYLLDLLSQAQTTYQQHPMQSWGMLSPAARMQFAQGYYGADMLGSPMQGYQPPPQAPQPQPTAQPTQPQPQGGAPQGMLTKDQLRAMGPASGHQSVMVYDPSDGVVMMKPDGSGNWIRDIGASKYMSGGKGGSGAEEAAAARGTAMTSGVAAPAMPGLSAGMVAQQGPHSMAPSSGNGWSGTLGGIMGGMLGLAAGGPMGAIGGAMAGNRFGNWMGGR